MRFGVSDLYFVRVIGSLDNSSPAKVTAPWTPSIRNTDDVAVCSPLKCNSLDSSLQGSPRESPVTVKAYAGPMTSSEVGRVWCQQFVCTMLVEDFMNSCHR